MTSASSASTLAARLFPSEQTPVTAENLLARGYKEYPGSLQGEPRLFRRSFTDKTGKVLFLSFREWQHANRPLSYDAEVVAETDTTAAVWLTVKDAAIEEIERDAMAVWEAGGAYYDPDPTRL